MGSILAEFINNMVEITKDEFQDMIRGMQMYVSLVGATDGSVLDVYSLHVYPRLALEKFPDGRMYFYAQKIHQHDAFFDDMIINQRRTNQRNI